MATLEQIEYFKKQLEITSEATQQRRLQVIKPGETAALVEKEFGPFLNEVRAGAKEVDDGQDRHRKEILVRAELVEKTIVQIEQQLEFQKNALDDILQDVRYLFNINVDKSGIEDDISIEATRIEKGEDTFWPTPK